MNLGLGHPQNPGARRRLWRALLALAVCVGVGAGTAQITSGCQGSPNLVPVRSLQKSGKVSFVCLSPLEPSERPLAECTAQQFTSICQYEYQSDAGAADADVVRDDAGVPVATLFPHLYALVTQTETGEVAVVDTSALAGQVLDENPLEPGANFLHVGAIPTGIASTPGSVATFVGVAEIGRPGLFAIPSDQIRPATSFGVPDTCSGDSDAGAVLPPELSSWPACNLPSAPGDIIIIDDPPDPQNPLLQRASCDSTAYVVPATGSISAREGDVGRAKLVVAFPNLGGIGVFDAQTLFEQPPGSFDPCPIERWVPLKVDVAGLAGQPAPPTGLACSNPAQNVPPLLPVCPDGGAAGTTDGGAGCFYPQLGGMSYADGKLYVADLGAPVIHVVDMHDALGNPTPCNPIEQAPLLPSSAVQPARVVYASKVAAASQLTPDFKRYLYATDYIDSSAMIFDISPSSTTRRPLTRAHPEWDPFHPRDRVKFTAPPADIIIVQRDAPNIDPVTGLAPAGVLCNPDPNALSCTATSHNCDPGVAYQTSSDYSTGAGPLKLRGEFAFAALTNGRLAVIDIADFDAPCRGPVNPSFLAGCATQGETTPQPVNGEFNLLKTTAEVSCNVVSLGEPRASQYMAAGSFPGNHVPGILSFPLLYQYDGSVFAPDSAVPQMVATLPATTPPACNEDCNLSTNCTSSCVINDPVPGCPLETYVGGNLQPLFTNGTYADCSATSGSLIESVSLGTNNALAMNAEDPRAQVAGQNWTITFEGPLPGFAQRIGYLSSPASGPAILTDPSSLFCNQGVLGENAVSEQLVAKGLDPNAHPSAADLADYVQVTNNLPDATDTYWTGPSTSCNFAATYGTCFAQFGTTYQVELNTTRDLRILEAYQDHVEVEARNPFPPGAKCGAPGEPGCVSPEQCVVAAGSTTGTCQLPPVIDLLRCCFPTALTFSVRTGNQWNVVGDQSGFLHHVVADQTTGVCRNNCDGTFQRMNGRLVGTGTAGNVPDRPVGEMDPSPSFLNPMFRFGIKETPCNVDATCTATGALCLGGSGAASPTLTGICNPARDTVFKFSTVNTFSPLLVTLTTDATVLVEPTSATYLAATQEVAVTDGSFSGLIMVSLQTAAFSRSFF